MTVRPYAFRPLPARKRRKYGNKKCVYKGMAFDSILERDRWVFLEQMQVEGKVSALERQVVRDLSVNGTIVCAMRLDFRYWYHDHGRERVVYEDAKGVTTPEWSLKRKLFEAATPHRIHIVTKANLTSLPDAG